MRRAAAMTKRQGSHNQPTMDLLTRRLVASLACFTCLLASPPLSRAAAIDLLWIDGVQGGATNGTQSGWTDCISYTNMLGRSPDFRTVLTNAPTAMLSLLVSEGQPIRDIKLDVVLPNGDLYVAYTLSDCYLTSLTIKGALDEVDISYTRIAWSYPPLPLFQITSIVRTSANGLLVTWNTSGTRNIVQVTDGTGARGSFSTTGFTDLTNLIVTTPTTNFWDVGAATNGPSRYYRVRSPQ